jgi:hypothetical protein
MNIKTEYVYPPIPMRNFDWQACMEGWEPNDPIGVGATEEDAIADLMDQMGELA